MKRTDFFRAQIAALQEERSEFTAEIDRVIDAASAEGRTQMTSEEDATLDARAADIARVDEALTQARARLDQAVEDEAREAREAESRSGDGSDTAEQRAGGRAPTTVQDPATYRQTSDPNAPSFVRDLMFVGMNRGDTRGALERLHRNNQEVIEARALSTTDGAGGDFVPPLYVINQYIELARTARPTADRVQNQVLPGGTDQITVPKILTGTAVAEQATQNSAVQNTDATTGGVSANVATLAGGQTVAVQLIEQSPINMDTILMQDLSLDYAAKVDLFVLNNNAANKKGLLQEAGTNAVTYTSGAPTAALLYSKIADAIQRVTTSRFLPPDTIVMHPRRWASLLAATDSQGRPLFIASTGQGIMNALGTQSGVASANGVVGQVAGLDVILDPQIPTNLGAGTNQDPIVVFRAADSILWEGTPHVEAFRETNASTLSVYLRFYRYAAFTTARYAQSVSVINGTGLIAPTF